MSVLLLLSFAVSTLEAESFDFEPNKNNPFGIVNPKAPAEIKVFAPLIGESTCVSVARIDQDNWQEPENMVWRFKYIMNGMAIQDETLKAGGQHAGSIRLYHQQSQQWQIHYYSMTSAAGPLPDWQGGLKGKDLVFYRKQPAPNGMEGYYRLTFSDITEKRFNWIGEWVSLDESIVYPTWKISCQKQKS